MLRGQGEHGTFGGGDALACGGRGERWWLHWLTPVHRGIATQQHGPPRPRPLKTEPTHASSSFPMRSLSESLSGGSNHWWLWNAASVHRYVPTHPRPPPVGEREELPGQNPAGGGSTRTYPPPQEASNMPQKVAG
jgi:hypothetical protein